MVENESTEGATRHELCTNNSCDQPVVLHDDERQPCEVWTRVMGYYRPVDQYNIGKKQEYADRQCFSFAKAMEHVAELEEHHS